MSTLRPAACAALLLGTLALGPHAVAQPARAPAPATTAPAAASAPDAAADAAARGRLDELMKAVADAQGFSGTVLVARGGRVLFAQAYGESDAASHAANTLQTRFRIGSITKPFTALTVLRLQEQGKLATSDSVCKFIAPCPDAWQPVTVHHLLSHTSGIPSFTSLPDYRQFMGQPTTPLDTAKRVADKPLEFAPGEQFKYNNTGYVLLGAVIEKASGLPYAKAVAREILEPLGMKDTGYEGADTPLATGYKGDGSVAAPIHPTVPYAAGALVSTVTDLLKLDRAIAERRLLSEASWKTALTPVKGTYGYGWVVQAQPSGRTLINHDGGINGFASSFTRVADQDLAVIVLRNQERQLTFTRTLVAAALGEPYTVPKKRAIATVDPAIYDSYAGEYALAAGFSLTVRRDGARLLTQATGQPEVEVFPESPTSFFLTVVDAQIRFEKDASGAVTGLVLTQNGRDMPAKKVK